VQGPNDEISETITGTRLFSCGAKMHVRGTVASKAYATAKTTVADAVQVNAMRTV